VQKRTIFNLVAVCVLLLAPIAFSSDTLINYINDPSVVERCERIKQQKFKSLWGGSAGSQLGVESCQKQVQEKAIELKATHVFILDVDRGFTTSITAQFFNCSPRPKLMVAENAPIIAILPLEGKGISSDEADLLTDAIVISFQDAAKYKIMERAQISTILKEQGFSNSGACDTSDCAVKIGQLLVVKYIVTGTVGKLGESWIINLKMIDPSSGAIVNSVREKRKGSIEILTSLFDEIAKQF